MIATRSTGSTALPCRPGKTASAGPGTRRQLARRAPCRDSATAWSWRQLQRTNAAPTSTASTEAVAGLVRAQNLKRLKFLEEEALDALKSAVKLYQSPVFPCALIAGDVVILHLLWRAGLLRNEAVKIVYVDTFHLFPETHAFLQQCEALYGFKARVYQPAGFANKEEYKKKHGSDLYLTNIEQYDYICKVEPFNRALKETAADVMINGRRRDHGAERAHLEIFETGKAPVNCNPLAYWEFRDCWAYLESYQVPRHPLHEQGFPSVGDVHSTLPVPRGKWFEYGGERSGRFQGLTNSDGSQKTECGIHSPLSAPQS